MKTLTKVLNALSPTQKQVWEMIMQQNMTQYEVAEKLDISRSAVQHRLRKAKAKFIRLVQEDNE